jgi:hypothetical protein
MKLLEGMAGPVSFELDTVSALPPAHIRVTQRHPDVGMQ